MGTKNSPGDFDCYANAAPDEPMFILLARDPAAAWLVRVWADSRLYFKPGDPDNERQIVDAHECADAMEAWREASGKANSQ